MSTWTHVPNPVEDGTIICREDRDWSSSRSTESPGVKEKVLVSRGWRTMASAIERRLFVQLCVQMCWSVTAFSKKVYEVVSEPLLTIRFFFFAVVISWVRTSPSSLAFKGVPTCAIPLLHEVVDKAIDGLKKLVLNFALHCRKLWYIPTERCHTQAVEKVELRYIIFLLLIGWSILNNLKGVCDTYEPVPNKNLLCRVNLCIRVGEHWQWELQWLVAAL